MFASSLAITIFWTMTLEQMKNSYNVNISRSMFMVLNMCFVLFILLLVPLQSASAINIEKERDSWDLLISTNLSLGSILLGKLISSLTFVWLIAISLLPMYTIILPLGGISPNEIAFVFYMLTETSLVAALIGLLCSTYFKRVITSITATYLFGAGYFIGVFIIGIVFGERLNWDWLSSWIIASSPILPTVHFFQGSTPGGNYFAFQHPYLTHGVITACFIVILIFMIFRRLSKRDGVRSWEDRINDWLDQREKKRLQKRSATKAVAVRLLPDNRNPVSLKEKRGIQGRRQVRAWLTSIAIFIAPILIIFMFRNEREYFWFVFPLATVIVPWLVLPYACNAIRGERDRQTWDLLHTTTLTANSLMWGKFKTGLNLFHMRFWSYMAFPCLIFFWMASYAALPNHFEVDDIISIIITCYVAGFFYLTLGIYLSSVCRNTLTTYAIAFGVAITTYFILPLMSLIFIQLIMMNGRGGDDVFVFWAALFSPWIASLAYIDPPRQNHLIYSLVILIQCGGMGWVSYVFYLMSRDHISRISDKRDDG
jgi:ABC-type Na+ efflux pump permease subunit